MLALPNKFVDTFMAHTECPILIPMGGYKFRAVAFSFEPIVHLIFEFGCEFNGCGLHQMPGICFLLRRNSGNNWRPSLAEEYCASVHG